MAKRPNTQGDITQKATLAQQIERGLRKALTLEGVDYFVTTKQRKFLNSYMQSCRVLVANKSAGIAKTTHQKWMAIDGEYRKAFNAADDAAGEVLEEEAKEIAFAGDADMVKFLLKGYRKRYNQRQVEAAVDVRIQLAPNIEILRDTGRGIETVGMKQVENEAERPLLEDGSDD